MVSEQNWTHCHLIFISKSSFRRSGHIYNIRECVMIQENELKSNITDNFTIIKCISFNINSIFQTNKILSCDVYVDRTLNQ